MARCRHLQELLHSSERAAFLSTPSVYFSLPEVGAGGAGQSRRATRTGICEPDGAERHPPPAACCVAATSMCRKAGTRPPPQPPSLPATPPQGSPLRRSSWLFDLDERWAQLPCFCRFDFQQPEAIPAELLHSFDCVVIDPPFITHEVWAKYAQAAQLLLKPQGEHRRALLAGAQEQRDSAVQAARAALQGAGRRLAPVLAEPAPPLEPAGLAGVMCCCRLRCAAPQAR